MLQFFRNFFQSKLGIPVTLGFLALIAIAFASSDVSNTGTFGGVAGGDRVAVVGDRKISSGEFDQNIRTALEQVRSQNPTMSMPAFVEQGGVEEVLKQMIERLANAAYARDLGLRAGDNLVNSEILQIPQFRGANGEFDEAVFKRLIGQQGMSEAAFRDDLGNGLLAEQLLVPVSFGAKAPDKLVKRYASLLKERRKGSIAVIPSRAFAPAGAPSQDTIAKYYAANRGDFIRPERRVVRYATFGIDSLGQLGEPTEAEIRAQYAKDKAKYAASEERTITQLIVPTQQAAEAIRKRISGGGSFEQAAQEAGFDTAKLGPLSQDKLAGQSSAAVAQAVFAAPRGAVAAPARSGLGWHVVRVDAVDTVAARSLAQVRDEIAGELRDEKQQNAIADLAAKVEDQIDEGVSLADLAKTLDAQVQSTKPLLATGAVYGSTGETAPPVLAPALETAFQMGESEPQLAEIEAGKTFLIFEASQITPSAPAPLSDIRGDVVDAWRQAEGAKAAKAAADRILARVKSGATVAAAVSQEKAALPGVDSIDMTREQVGAMQGRIPPPLALMFSMAEGTAKRLEAPRNAGWFVVGLGDIEAGKVADNDPLLAQAKEQIGTAMGQEYAAQLQNGLRGEVGIERNKSAIDALKKRLSGQN